MNLAGSANPQIAKALSQEKVANEPLAKQDWPQKLLSKLDWQQKFLSRLRISVWNLLIALGLVFLASVIVRMLLTGVSITWLVQIPTATQPVGDFSTVLAPLLAVAVAIERLLETGFDWYEKSLVSVARVLEGAEQADDWIQNELRGAYLAMQTAAGSYLNTADDATLQLFEKAQKRLADAESRLMDWVKAPEYIAWKRAIAIVVGLCAGLVVAVSSDLGIMRTIGVPAPRFVDMLATGLVIGAGPGPMHSLIGILESGKTALDNVGQLAQSKALLDAAQSIQIGANSAGPKS